MTGEEQPLDRFIFGSMKNIANKLWSEYKAKDPCFLYTRENACKIMIESWENVNDKTITKSWEHIINTDE